MAATGLTMSQEAVVAAPVDPVSGQRQCVWSDGDRAQVKLIVMTAESRASSRQGTGGGPTELRNMFDANFAYGTVLPGLGAAAREQTTPDNAETTVAVVTEDAYMSVAETEFTAPRSDKTAAMVALATTAVDRLQGGTAASH
jgi:hypothetical protein